MIRFFVCIALTATTFLGCYGGDSAGDSPGEHVSETTQAMRDRDAPDPRPKRCSFRRVVPRNAINGFAVKTVSGRCPDQPGPNGGMWHANLAIDPQQSQFGDAIDGQYCGYHWHAPCGVVVREVPEDADGLCTEDTQKISIVFGGPNGLPRGGGCGDCSGYQ
jgi:hypothetical protein